MTRRTRRTIRRLPPISREIARLANDLDRLSRRAAALAEKTASAESLAAAGAKHLAYFKAHGEG